MSRRKQSAGRAAARAYTESFDAQAGAAVTVKTSHALRYPAILLALDGETTILTVDDTERLIELLKTAILAARIGR